MKAGIKRDYLAYFLIPVKLHFVWEIDHYKLFLNQKYELLNKNIFTNTSKQSVVQYQRNPLVNGTAIASLIFNNGSSLSRRVLVTLKRSSSVTSHKTVSHSNVASTVFCTGYMLVPCQTHQSTSICHDEGVQEMLTLSALGHHDGKRFERISFKQW